MNSSINELLIAYSITAFFISLLIGNTIANPIIGSSSIEKPLSTSIVVRFLSLQVFAPRGSRGYIINNGFLKIPISELLELEKKWILNKNEQYFINFKRNINLTKEEKEFLKNNQIKVSISNSWEPFTFISSNNEASGILTEYWNLISEKINLNFENKIYSSFVEQVKSLEDKKSDLVYGIGETSKRKEFAIFSKEYLKFPMPNSPLLLFPQHITSPLDKIEQLDPPPVAT